MTFKEADHLPGPNTIRDNLSNQRYLKSEIHTRSLPGDTSPEIWLKGLSGDVADAILLTDRSGHIWMMNPAAIDLFGYQPSGSIKHISALMAHPEELQSHIKSILSNGAKDCFPLECLTMAHREQQLSCSATAIYAEVGKVIGFRIVISGRPNTDEMQINVATEKERQRIALELHDGINQMLAGASLRLEAILTGSVPMESSQLRQLKSALDGAIREVRKVSHNLMPCDLEENGLRNALKKLSEDLTSTGILKMKMDLLPEEELPASKPTALAIYRIVQEFVQNTIKHSEAKEAHIELTREENSYLLQLRDNGSGFYYRENSEGCGLRNIKTRVRDLKGTFQLKTAPGKGVEMKVLLPC